MKPVSFPALLRAVYASHLCLGTHKDGKNVLLKAAVAGLAAVWPSMPVELCTKPWHFRERRVRSSRQQPSWTEQGLAFLVRLLLARSADAI